MKLETALVIVAICLALVIGIIIGGVIVPDSCGTSTPPYQIKYINQTISHRDYYDMCLDLVEESEEFQKEMWERQ